MLTNALKNVPRSFNVGYVRDMVLILDGSSDHIARVWRQAGFQVQIQIEIAVD